MKILEYIITAKNKVGAAVQSAKKDLGGLSQMSSGLKSMLGGMGLSLGLAGVVAGIKSVLDYGGQMKDLADISGMNASSFQSLAAAARGVGMRSEALAQQLSRLRDIQASIGTDEGMQTTFQKLGIAVSEVRDMKPDALLELIAQRIRETGDESAAFDLFGRSAGKMLETMKELEGGIDNLKQKYGDLILSDSDLSDMDAATDGLERWFTSLEVAAGLKLVGIKAQYTQLSDAFKAQLYGVSNEEGAAASTRSLKFQRQRMEAGLKVRPDQPVPGPTPPPPQMADSTAKAVADAEKKLFDAQATAQQKMTKAQQDLATVLAEKSGERDPDKLGKLRVREVDAVVRIRALQKDMDDEAARAAKDAAALRQQAMDEEARERQRMAAEELRAAKDVERARIDAIEAEADARRQANQELVDLARGAAAEQGSNAAMYRAMADAALEDFMDPAQAAAKDDEAKKRAKAAEEATKMAKWNAMRPEAWLDPQEKAALRYVKAKAEEQRMLDLQASIEAHIANLDKVLGKES